MQSIIIFVKAHSFPGPDMSLVSGVRYILQAPEHPLLVKERTGSSVRPLRLAYMLYDGKQAFERMVAIQAKIEADPTFDR